MCAQDKVRRSLHRRSHLLKVAQGIGGGGLMLHHRSDQDKYKHARECVVLHYRL